MKTLLALVIGAVCTFSYPRGYDGTNDLPVCIAGHIVNHPIPQCIRLRSI